ncbi:MAG: 50S ribosomal protein L6 [Victivallaceae bacterium]|nr:50S ribosomal protein L6 [Victivallaceae bacterium]
MSRIGNKVIDIPAGVKVNVADGVVTVEGKSKLTLTLPPKVAVELDGAQLHVRQSEDSGESSAMQGLARSLIHNMVVGVVSGFRKELQIVGVGYRAQIAGNKLTLNVGFSHPIEYTVPEGVKVTVVENVKMIIEGADKQLVGETAATIRRFRKPEPYKGKGIRYVDETIILKEGKSVG